MPSCSICGAQMTLIKRGRGGKGGPGNRYRCPNTPHKKCPKCQGVLITKFAEETYCPKCGYKELKSPRP